MDGITKACHGVRSSQPGQGSLLLPTPWSSDEASTDQEDDLDDLPSPDTPLDFLPDLSVPYAWEVKEERRALLQDEFLTDRERLRCLAECLYEAQASLKVARNDACGEPTQLCRKLSAKVSILKAKYRKTENMLICEMLEAVNGDRLEDIRPTLDLHFQRCAVLKSVLQVACEVVALAGGRELDVIAGWGRHSEAGTCDLKMTALRVLMELGVNCKVADHNPGLVEVMLEGWLPPSAGGKQGILYSPCPRLEQVLCKLLTAPHRANFT
ncbi:hypothetical protein N2152v2_002373 [Parachlorella kessleri]